MAGLTGCGPRGGPGDGLTTETGGGQGVKLHRGGGHNKTEGRALLAGTIAHSARDRVCPECRRMRASRRVDVGFRRWETSPRWILVRIDSGPRSLDNPASDANE